MTTLNQTDVKSPLANGVGVGDAGVGAGSDGCPAGVDTFSSIDPVLGEMVAELPSTSEGYLSATQADFLYHFVLLTRPRLVVETGFNVGHSALVILRAMSRYGGGTLLSFDIGRHEGTAGGAALVKSRYEDFHLFEGDTKEVLGPSLGQVLNRHPGATLDLAIVDGGHDMQTCQADLMILEALLAPGGYLWLDDFESLVCRCINVSIVGREFARSRPNCMRFNTADHRGMMIFQKGF